MMIVAFILMLLNSRKMMTDAISCIQCDQQFPNASMKQQCLEGGIEPVPCANVEHDACLVFWFRKQIPDSSRYFDPVILTRQCGFKRATPKCETKMFPSAPKFVALPTHGAKPRLPHDDNHIAQSNQITTSNNASIFQQTGRKRRSISQSTNISPKLPNNRHRPKLEIVRVCVSECYAADCHLSPIFGALSSATSTFSHFHSLNAHDMLSQITVISFVLSTYLFNL